GGLLAAYGPRDPQGAFPLSLWEVKGAEPKVRDKADVQAEDLRCLTFSSDGASLKAWDVNRRLVWRVDGGLKNATEQTAPPGTWLLSHGAATNRSRFVSATMVGLMVLDEKDLRVLVDGEPGRVDLYAVGPSGDRFVTRGRYGAPDPGYQL